MDFNTVRIIFEMISFGLFQSRNKFKIKESNIEENFQYILKASINIEKKRKERKEMIEKLYSEYPEFKQEDSEKLNTDEINIFISSKFLGSGFITELEKVRKNEVEIKHIQESFNFDSNPYWNTIKYFTRSKFSNLLYESLTERKNNDAETKEYNSVIESLIISRIAKDYKSYIYLLFSSIFILASSIYNSLNIVYIFVPILLSSLLYINQMIIKYRISKGWYGNNYYEAKEIIDYITQHYDKDDFFDGGKLKDIFPEVKKEDSTYSDIVDGVRT